MRDLFCAGVCVCDTNLHVRATLCNNNNNTCIFLHILTVWSHYTLPCRVRLTHFTEACVRKNSTEHAVYPQFSPVENDMDPDIFDDKQIFVLNTLY